MSAAGFVSPSKVHNSIRTLVRYLSVAKVYEHTPRCVRLVIGGVCVGGAISASLWYTWPLIFLGLVPLIDTVYDNPSKRGRDMASVLWFGIPCFGLVVGSIWSSYPLDWLGISSPVAGHSIVAGAWIITTVVLASTVSIWFGIVRIIITRTALDILTVPLSWVLFEWIRMWVCTYVWWGSGSVPVPFFSLGFVGLGLAPNDALLNVARIGGVFAMSWFAFFGAMIVYDLIYPIPYLSNKARAVIRWSIAISIFILYVHPFSPPSQRLMVATMSTNIPSTITTSHEKETQQMTFVEQKLVDIQHSGIVPDIVVIPEGLNFIHVMQSRGTDPASYVQSLFDQHEVLIVTTDRTDGFRGTYEQIELFSSTHGIIATRNKYVLMPVGEYMPWMLEYIVRWTGLSSIVDSAKRNRSYHVGSMPTVIEYKGASLVVFSCSELLSPTLFREVGSGHTNLLFIDSSSLSMFHGGHDPFVQMRDMARIHAAWNDAPYYQSTNGAPDIRVE